MRKSVLTVFVLRVKKSVRLQAAALSTSKSRPAKLCNCLRNGFSRSRVFAHVSGNESHQYIGTAPETVGKLS